MISYALIEYIEKRLRLLSHVSSAVKARDDVESFTTSTYTIETEFDILSKGPSSRSHSNKWLLFKCLILLKSLQIVKDIFDALQYMYSN